MAKKNPPISTLDTETLLQAYAGQRNPYNLKNRHPQASLEARDELIRRGVDVSQVQSQNTGGAVHRGGLRGFAQKVGSIAKIAAPVLALTGVGAPLAAAIGAGGGLLSGGGVKGALTGAAGGLAGGAAKAALGGAGGLKGIIQKGVSVLGGKGLPGSKGSLLGQLATAIPGVIGTVQGLKAGSRQNRLLQSQSDILGEEANTARGLINEAAPIRRAAQARIMSRLTNPPDLSFVTDRLNPFTSQFAPGGAPAPSGASAVPGAAPGVAPLAQRRRRPVLSGSTPFLSSALAPS